MSFAFQGVEVAYAPEKDDGSLDSAVRKGYDLEKLTASHRHGMLRLTLPLKESVKPRRIQIETEVEEHKQLAGAGAR